MRSPLWKIVNFSTFSTYCFYCLEMRFLIQEYHETNFPALYCLKTKTMGKWPIFDQNHENLNFSTFSTCCFHSVERRFFVPEYRKRHFNGLYYLKKKVVKIAIFGPKPWVNPFGKMSIFRLFGLHVFIA